MDFLRANPMFHTCLGHLFGSLFAAGDTIEIQSEAQCTGGGPQLHAMLLGGDQRAPFVPRGFRRDPQLLSNNYRRAAIDAMVQEVAFGIWFGTFDRATGEPSVIPITRELMIRQRVSIVGTREYQFFRIKQDNPDTVGRTANRYLSLLSTRSSGPAGIIGQDDAVPPGLEPLDAERIVWGGHRDLPSPDGALASCAMRVRSLYEFAQQKMLNTALAEQRMATDQIYVTEAVNEPPDKEYAHVHAAPLPGGGGAAAAAASEGIDAATTEALARQGVLAANCADNYPKETQLQYGMLRAQGGGEAASGLQVPQGTKPTQRLGAPVQYNLNAGRKMVSAPEPKPPVESVGTVLAGLNEAICGQLGIPARLITSADSSGKPY
jgi:hypothetical protein